MKTPSPLELAAGKLLKQEIERLGSQAAFARQICVSQQCVSKWVRLGYVPAQVMVRHPDIFLLRGASTHVCGRSVSVTIFKAPGA